MKVEKVETVEFTVTLTRDEAVLFMGALSHARSDVSDLKLRDEQHSFMDDIHTALYRYLG